VQIKPYPTTKKTNGKNPGKSRSKSKEDQISEPGSDPNTWLIEAKFDFVSPGVEAEIIEVTISEPTRFTVRRRGDHR